MERPRSTPLKSTLGGSSVKLRGDFSQVGKIQRCRLHDRLWRANGAWSQVLLPTKHDRRRLLSPREGVAQKQTLWAIVSSQTANRSSFDIRLLRQLLPLTANNCWDRSKARSTAYFFNYLFSARFRSVRPIRIGRNTYGCSSSVRRETAHTFAMMDATKSWSLRKFLSELSCFLQNLLTREPGPCRIFCLGCERFEIGLP